MKSFFFLSALFLLFSCSDNTAIEIGQKTTMDVKPVFDAGKVLHGEEINANFVLTNTGDYPLVIAEIKGSWPPCKVGLSGKNAAVTYNGIMLFER